MRHVGAARPRRPPQQEPTLITFIDADLPVSAQVVKVAVQFNPKELSTTKVARANRDLAFFTPPFSILK